MVPRPLATLVRLALAAAPATVLGCDASSGVSLQGYLFDTPWPVSDAAPVPGADLSAFPDHDPDDTYVGGELGTSGSGAYLVGFFEPGAVVHLVFTPTVGDLLPTAIPVVVPDTAVDVDDGVFHVWHRVAASAALGGDDLLPGPGHGALIGALADAADREGDPVSLTTAAGALDPVYLDATGAADPALSGTSAGGGFAFAFVPPGTAVLHTGSADLAVWIVEGAVTSVRADAAE